MPEKIVLYCKSYRTDLNRVVRLMESITKFNTDRIPVFLSTPASDVELFKSYLRNFEVEIVTDELIISQNPTINLKDYNELPGNLSQQIVKSEFWRLGFADTYLCLDSDAVFIRPFSYDDFFCADALPYTVIDENRELLETSLLIKKTNILESFKTEAASVQKLFDRAGKAFAFGPFPLLWHKAVWTSLDEQYLKPRNMSLLDAIVQTPLESRWYGEALLKYRAIPLVPCQPLFKVYHYAWQLDHDRGAGMTNEKLAQLYSGVIYQSAWERELDWPREGGNLMSRIARRLRRRLGRI